MSVDTQGYINKQVSIYEITDYLKTLPQKYKSIHIKGNYIEFMNGKDERSLYVNIDTKDSTQEDIGYYKMEELNSNLITYIKLGYWGKSVDIISDIVKYFGGGYIIPDDTKEIVIKINTKS
jgi:hypothetical protein